MKKRIIKSNQINIAVIEDNEVIICNAQNALDLFADLQYIDDCDILIINKEAITESFFDLSTGIAGEILQKIVNYGKKIAIVGDFSLYSSKALHDFIYECNKGRNIFFVGTLDDAIEKL